MDGYYQDFPGLPGLPGFLVIPGSPNHLEYVCRNQPGSRYLTRCPAPTTNNEQTNKRKVRGDFRAGC